MLVTSAWHALQLMLLKDACVQDLPGMIDAAKFADLVLLVIDGNFGFEMETFEFLNILQVRPALSVCQQDVALCPEGCKAATRGQLAACNSNLPSSGLIADRPLP